MYSAYVAEDCQNRRDGDRQSIAASTTVPKPRHEWSKKETWEISPYLDNIDKFLINSILDHPLADKVRHTAKKGVDCRNLTIPRHQTGDQGSVDAGGFGAAVGIFG